MKLGSYLSKLSGRELTTEQNAYVGMYLKTITDLERISDHAMNIAAVVIESKNGTMNVHSAMKEIRNEHLHSFDEFYEVFSRKYLPTEE